MGNLQSNDPKSSKTGKSAKVKTLIKIRGKRNKQEDNQFTGVVPKTQLQEHASSEDDLTLKEARPTSQKLPDNLLVTDSWCKINKPDPTTTEGVTPSADSSSDSVFAEALTPVAFSTEINQCYRSEDSFPTELEISDNFLHDLTLNSFKLNEYRVRKEEVGQKLSKLGISRTSQISLETDPKECFVSDNVEVVRKDEYSEADGEESGFGGSGEKEGAPMTGKVLTLAKRLSDGNLSNGEFYLDSTFFAAPQL